MERVITYGANIMPDITMCAGYDVGTNNLIVICQVREKCYRHVAPAFEYGQTYSTFEPERGDECDYFMRATPENIEAFKRSSAIPLYPEGLAIVNLKDKTPKETNE